MALGADASVFKPFGAMYAEQFENTGTAKEPTAEEIMGSVKEKLARSIVKAPKNGG